MGKVVLSQQKLFQKIDYSPHKMQEILHREFRRHRFIVASCGRRFGKSQFGGHELTTSAIQASLVQAQLSPKGRRHEYWIVGPEYTDAEKEFRVLYNDLLKLGVEFDKPGTYYDSGGGNMHISLFGGRFLVAAKSAKYPDTLVGEGLMGVIMAEAAKLKSVVWSKYIRPTLADYKGWAIMTSTPEGRNWFYDSYMRGQDPTDTSWFSLRAPSWSNNVLFPLGKEDPEILELARDMTDEKFNQEIGADFTEFVGRVFKDFDEETHVGNYPYDPRYPVYIAQDAGFTNPAVILFLQKDVFDNVWICGEYYQRNRTPIEIAEDVLSDDRLRPMVQAAREIYPDPEDPGAYNTLADKWRVTPVSKTGGVLSNRLDLIRRWLKPQPASLPDGHIDKRPKLTVDLSCKETIREMSEYRYPETRKEAGTDSSEKPMKKDDHAPEALGRFFAGHFGTDGDLQEGTTRINKVKHGR